MTTVPIPQLSEVTDGTPRLTPLAVHKPLSALTVTVGGQLIVGASVSWIVTVNEQVAVLYWFEAVQSTVLIPTGKRYGEVTTVAPILHCTEGVGKPVAVTANGRLLEH